MLPLKEKVCKQLIQLASYVLTYVNFMNRINNVFLITITNYVAYLKIFTALQPPQSISTGSGDRNGTIRVNWQAPSSPPVDITRYSTQ